MGFHEVEEGGTGKRSLSLRGYEPFGAEHRRNSVSLREIEPHTSFLQPGKVSMVLVGYDHSCLGQRGSWIAACFLESKINGQVMIGIVAGEHGCGATGAGRCSKRASGYPKAIERVKSRGREKDWVGHVIWTYCYLYG